MDRAIKAQEAARNKNLRDVYRADLENQRAAAERRKLEEKLEDQRQANNSVLYQQQRADYDRAMAGQKREQIRAQVIQKQRESALEKEANDR